MKMNETRKTTMIDHVGISDITFCLRGTEIRPIIITNPPMVSNKFKLSFPT